MRSRVPLCYQISYTRKPCNMCGETANPVHIPTGVVGGVLGLWSAEIPFSRPITRNQALGALAFNMLRAGGQEVLNVL